MLPEPRATKLMNAKPNDPIHAQAQLKLSMTVSSPKMMSMMSTYSTHSHPMITQTVKQFT